MAGNAGRIVEIQRALEEIEELVGLKGAQSEKPRLPL